MAFWSPSGVLAGTAGLGGGVGTLPIAEGHHGGCLPGRRLRIEVRLALGIDPFVDLPGLAQRAQGEQQACHQMLLRIRFPCQTMR